MRIGERKAVVSMSRLAVFVLVPFLVSSTAFAQESSSEDHRQRGLGVQIIGGPLFSNLADATSLDTKHGAGFLVGLSMGGNRGGRVGVGADVLYGKKKAEISGSTFDQSVVHVPVMLKVNMGSTSRHGFSVLLLGGGFFDWQFSSTLGDLDISEDTDGYEVGYVLGGGVEVLRFTIQGRYMRGLKEIGKTFDLTEVTNTRTQSFAILFGIRLN